MKQSNALRKFPKAIKIPQNGWKKSSSKWTKSKLLRKDKKMITINPELYENKDLYIYEGMLVKIFPSTIGWKTRTATAEIMDGPDKGKWTTIYLRKGIQAVDAQ
jgi:hypothetical protein